MNKKPIDYDIQKRSRAGTAAMLRAAVAAYIIYLGGKLISGASDPATSMQPWQCWLFGCFFLAAGLAVGVYAWRRWRLDLKAAVIEQMPQEEENGEDQTES